MRQAQKILLMLQKVLQQLLDMEHNWPEGSEPNQINRLQESLLEKKKLLDEAGELMRSLYLKSPKPSGSAVRPPEPDREEIRPSLKEVNRLFRKIHTLHEKHAAQLNAQTGEIKKSLAEAQQSLAMVRQYNQTGITSGRVDITG